MSDPLAGLAVLVVEDEAMVAMLVEDTIEAFGCRLAASVSHVAGALAAIAREVPGLALLDVNLDGETSYPVAEALAERAVPFVFVTGYGAAGLAADWRDHTVVQKPFTAAGLRAAMLAVLGGVAEGRDAG